MKKKNGTTTIIILMQDVLYGYPGYDYLPYEKKDFCHT